jgi:hypothetical protein
MSRTDDDATAVAPDQTSNQQQYLRKFGLIVTAGTSGLDLSNMRTVFKTFQADLPSTPNYATIKVYNLSDATAKSVQKEFTAVRLQAGYEGGSYGAIFNGTIKYVRRGRDNPTDTYLEIIAADGDVGRNFGIVNTTLAAGAKIGDQLAATTKAMGLPAGYTPDLPATALSRGKVLYGMARDRMDDISASANATWSIQNGQVQVVPLTSYIPGTAVVLNSNSGMIGLPQQTEDGIHIQALINPRIKIGALLQIDNKSIQTAFLGGQNLFNQGRLENIPGLLPKVTWDGFYRVYVAEHDGDTRGQAWYSNIICLAIDKSAPVANSVKADG